MSSDTQFAISAEHLGKRYSLGEAAGLLSSSRWRKRRDSTSQTPLSFWALDDVSFQIRKGEAVGIIGRNGAGKSTLLKVLSRITEPSCGRAVINGRVASLLEVGTGFHQELTGRENIYMNGSILGMRRAEITRSFDEIVEFADVEKFLDTPVKRYSSGMYVRLAFSVAAHLEPEILVVDEVLAVGDIQFQKKCLGKMGDVSRSGRTVLFVSHNMAAIRQLTTRCILLKAGAVALDGEPSRAIQLYSDAAGSNFHDSDSLAKWPRPAVELTRQVEFEALGFCGRQPSFDPDESIAIEIVVRPHASFADVRLSGTVFQADGSAVGSFFCRNTQFVSAGQLGKFRISLDDHRLAPGSYSLGMALGQGDEVSGMREHDIVMEVLPFEIRRPIGEGGTLTNWPASWGPVRLQSPQFEKV